MIVYVKQWVWLTYFSSFLFLWKDYGSSWTTFTFNNIPRSPDSSLINLQDKDNDDKIEGDFPIQVYKQLDEQNEYMYIISIRINLEKKIEIILD